jgi:hypothetical protein
MVEDQTNEFNFLDFLLEVLIFGLVLDFLDVGSYTGWHRLFLRGFGTLRRRSRCSMA